MVREEHVRAFTLIELMCVTAIAVVILGITLGAVIGWGRSAGIRTSAAEVKASLEYARQWAVTRHTGTSFVYSNGTDGAYYYLMKQTTNGLIGSTNYLAAGVVFTTNDAPEPVDFLSDGTCGGTDQEWPHDKRRIVLVEDGRPSGIRATVTVFRATGYARVSK
ncbi:MAG: prepilin-type N-terminal cleavage/methylation domain-containing protein [Kiritimatiellia bacterium]